MHIIELPKQVDATFILHKYYQESKYHVNLLRSQWQLLQAKTPTQQQVRESYDLSSERIRHRDYRTDIGKPRKVICL